MSILSYKNWYKFLILFALSFVSSLSGMQRAPYILAHPKSVFEKCCETTIRMREAYLFETEFFSIETQWLKEWQEQVDGQYLNLWALYKTAKNLEREILQLRQDKTQEAQALLLERSLELTTLKKQINKQKAELKYSQWTLSQEFMRRINHLLPGIRFLMPNAETKMQEYFAFISSNIEKFKNLGEYCLNECPFWILGHTPIWYFLENQPISPSVEVAMAAERCCPFALDLMDYKYKEMSPEVYQDSITGKHKSDLYVPEYPPARVDQASTAAASSVPEQVPAQGPTQEIEEQETEVSDKPQDQQIATKQTAKKSKHPKEKSKPVQKTSAVQKPSTGLSVNTCIDILQNANSSIKTVRNALNCLEKHVKNGDPKVLFFCGIYNASDHRYSDGSIQADEQTACRLLEACINTDSKPDKAEAQFVLSKLIFKQGQDYQRAALLVDSAIENGYVAPDNDYLLLAKLYFCCSRFDQALQWAQKAQDAQLVKLTQAMSLINNDKLAQALELIDSTYPLLTNVLSETPKSSSQYVTEIAKNVSDRLNQILNRCDEVSQSAGRLIATLLRMGIALNFPPFLPDKDTLIKKLSQQDSDGQPAVQFILGYLCNHGIDTSEEYSYSATIYFGRALNSYVLELNINPTDIRLCEIIEELEPLRQKFIDLYINEVTNEQEYRLNVNAQTHTEIRACYLCIPSLIACDKPFDAAILFVAVERAFLCLWENESTHQFSKWPGFDFVRSFFKESVNQKNTPLDLLAAMSMVDGFSNLRQPEDSITKLSKHNTRFVTVTERINVDKMGKPNSQRAFLFAQAYNIIAQIIFIHKIDCQKDLSIQCMRKASALCPDSKFFQANLGAFMIYQSDPADENGLLNGIRILSSVADKIPMAAYTLGTIYDPELTSDRASINKIKNLEKALNFYKMAFENGSKLAAKRLAELLIHTGTVTNADLQKLNHYIQQAGDELSQFDILNLLITLLTKLQQYDAVLVTMDKFEEIGADILALSYERALIYYAKRDYINAGNQMIRYLELFIEQLAKGKKILFARRDAENIINMINFFHLSKKDTPDIIELFDRLADRLESLFTSHYILSVIIGIEENNKNNEYKMWLLLQMSIILARRGNWLQMEQLAKIYINMMERNLDSSTFMEFFTFMQKLDDKKQANESANKTNIEMNRIITELGSHIRNFIANNHIIHLSIPENSIIYL